MTPEFEQLSFEDPTELSRCIMSDCRNYRAGNTPLCVQHLRDQEVAAGATSIVEPEAEAAAKAAGDRVMQMYVGPDPDVNGIVLPGPPTLTQTPPDPTELEPHWDGTQWVLREKRRNVSAYAAKLGAIASLVRELMHELGIAEADPDD